MGNRCNKNIEKVLSNIFSYYIEIDIWNKYLNIL